MVLFEAIPIERSRARVLNRASVPAPLWSSQSGALSYEAATSVGVPSCYAGEGTGGYDGCNSDSDSDGFGSAVLKAAQDFAAATSPSNLLKVALKYGPTCAFGAAVGSLEANPVSMVVGCGLSVTAQVAEESPNRNVKAIGILVDTYNISHTYMTIRDAQENFGEIVATWRRFFGGG
jgi:hypothetical protein